MIALSVTSYYHAIKSNLHDFDEHTHSNIEFSIAAAAADNMKI